MANANHSAKSQSIPRIVVCHFSHKFDTLPLKRETSASLTPYSSTSTISAPSYLPSIGRSWLHWRRTAAGTATESEDDDNGSHYESTEEHQEGDDGSFAQRGGYHHHQEEQNHSDTDQEPSNRPHTSHRSKQSLSQVSDGSSLTDSQLSLTDSQGSSSKSRHSGSGSAPSKRQSSSNPSKSRRKKHKARDPSAPSLPDAPLDFSSHAGRDRHRIQQSKNKMANTRSGGETSTTNKSSNPKKKGSTKKKRDYDSDSDSDSSSGSSQGSRPTKKQLKRMTKAEIESLLMKAQRDAAKQELAFQKQAAMLDKYRQRHADSGGVVGGVSHATSEEKRAALAPFRLGDPSDPQDDYHSAIYDCMLGKVYRMVKFINKESLKTYLAKKVVEQIDMDGLKLTGDPEIDAGKYHDLPSGLP